MQKKEKVKLYKNSKKPKSHITTSHLNKRASSIADIAYNKSIPYKNSNKK